MKEKIYWHPWKGQLWWLVSEEYIQQINTDNNSLFKEVSFNRIPKWFVVATDELDVITKMLDKENSNNKSILKEFDYTKIRTSFDKIAFKWNTQVLKDVSIYMNKLHEELCPDCPTKLNRNPPIYEGELTQ